MLRMRRASPHGRWIETRRRRSFGRKRPRSFRPDAASRDAPRFGSASNALRSQAGLRTRRFLPGAPAFPFADTRTVASGAARTDLPLRGQCRDGWGLTPGAPASRFTRRAWNARRTPATVDYSHGGVASRPMADLLYFSAFQHPARQPSSSREPQALHPYVWLPDERVRLGED